MTRLWWQWWPRAQLKCPALSPLYNNVLYATTVRWAWLSKVYGLRASKLLKAK